MAITGKMKSLVKKLIAPVILATALLFSPVKANPIHSSEKINAPEYAEEVRTDQSGYKHWRFGNVWYSNAPLEEYSEKRFGLSKALGDTIHYEDIRMDPFSQPNDSNLVWYGSGDLNNDNQRTQVDLDSILAKYGPIDEADVDGNGISFEANDQVLLQNFIQDYSNFLPGDWNKIGLLEDYPEKLNSWFDKTMIIDSTSEIPYSNDWQCGDFSMQSGVINFYGLGEINKDSSLIKENYLTKYDFSNNGRFNIPVFYVTISSKETGLAHAIITGLTNYQGQGPLDFFNWKFKEPQDDSDVSPGDWSMPDDATVKIYHSYFYDSTYLGRKIFLQEPFIEFQLTDGIPEFVKNADRLILERPYVNSIKPEKLNLLEKFVLNQNYPNPFNSQTKIKYSIPKAGNVFLNVYNLEGKLIRTLFNNHQQAGDYRVTFNAKNLPSGQYFYRLRIEDAVETKKMMLVK